MAVGWITRAEPTQSAPNDVAGRRRSRNISSAEHANCPSTVASRRHPADVALVAQHRHFHVEAISGNDGPPKLRFVDAGQVWRLARELARLEDDRAAELCHRFEHVHAGQDADCPGKCPVKTGSLYVMFLYPRTRTIGSSSVMRSIEQNRIAVRQDLEDLPDV